MPISSTNILREWLYTTFTASTARAMKKRYKSVLSPVSYTHLSLLYWKQYFTNALQNFTHATYIKSKRLYADRNLLKGEPFKSLATVMLLHKSSDVFRSARQVFTGFFFSVLLYSYFCKSKIHFKVHEKTYFEEDKRCV